MFSIRQTNKKQSLLTDDYQQQDIIIQQRWKKNNGNKYYQKNKEVMLTNMVCDEKSMNEIMKKQKQKDRENLKEWKRNRDTKKRVENILLLQSRRIKEANKLLSVKVFDEYEEHEGTSICKHYCHQAISNYCKDCFYGSTPIYCI